MNPITDGLQPSLKLWGEEEIDGAVYTVYLKKVRYHHARADLSEEISHLEWETIRVKMIKAGTLEKLMESLTTDTGELESTYMNIFLSTYRSFASPNQVLSILLTRYEQMHNESLQFTSETKEQHKRTLEKVLLVWLDMYPEDFFEPPQYLSLLKIKEFAEEYIPGCVLEVRAKHRLLKYKKADYSGTINNLSLDFSSEMKLLSLSMNCNILDIPDKDFAMQLTFTDNELFKKLVPYQCLGSAWSRRDKVCGWNVSPSTVTATINQFNAVSLRVISTILSDLFLKTTQRARIITKWINIAQELRFLKNFSSLKAITAALQSNSIHRLSKVWLSVPRDKIEVFSELAKIFSEENNQTNCRELLIKEGSAKFVNTIWSNKLCLKSSEKMCLDHTCTMQGTIPYLGTFLTDLTMIDVAIHDFLPNGLINFDKKRKEFEILAQIKLLQSAANSYDIQVDNEFQAWFSSVPVFDEKESYDRSCLIEPQDTTFHSKKHVFDNVKNSVFKWTHQKSESTPSTTSNGFLCDKNSNEINVSNIVKENGIKMSKSCSSLSIAHHNSNTMCNGVASALQDFYIIKVSLEHKNCDMGGINMYKSIMLNNSDHTRTVIANAMLKHSINGDPEDYMLVQLVPGGEIAFPDSANVYYAVNRNHELKFVLRSRFKNDTSRLKKRTAS